MDRKGYVLSGISFLLLIPVLILSISFINMINTQNEIMVHSIHSDNLYYASKDIKRNIPVQARESLNETVQEIIYSNLNIDDGPDHITKILQQKIYRFESDLKKNNNLEMECTINSIKPSNNPWFIEINYSLTLSKDKFFYEEKISQLVSIKDLYDPLPFIICGEYGTLNTSETRIFYGNILREYLQDKGIAYANYYENASSPFIIKSCPYQPYLIHADQNTMKNCLKNGFYHQSSDGSCYLCRLEGKATCNHAGLEVFINPGPLNETSLISSAVSIDHVIFDKDIYTGKLVTLYSFHSLEYFLFLDNGHRHKYGISVA